LVKEQARHISSDILQSELLGTVLEYKTLIAPTPTRKGAAHFKEVKIAEL
jgi:hypothetical protein